ncbi:MAG: hypothetical protein V1672_01055 [Candidatus Diapherotrites archaeon]
MLDHPTFPVAFALEEVMKLLEKLLKEKNWHKFDTGDVALEYVPFLLFNSDSFSEEHTKDDKLVKETKSGFHALNTVTRELNYEIASEFDKLDAELGKDEAKNYSPKIIENLLDEKSAVKISQSLLAKELEIPRYNIIITGMREIYVPFWAVYVTVAEGTFKIKISAINGKVFGLEKVPVREKGFLEITEETLEELKNPGAWLKYTKEIVAGSGKKEVKEIKKERKRKATEIKLSPAGILIAIVLLVIAVLLLYYFRII